VSGVVRGTGVFPLPQVELPRPSLSRSRRLKQRASRAVAETKLTNNAIRALNQLHTNSTSTHMQPRHSSLQSLSSNTLRAVAQVQSCARRHVRCLAPSFSTDSSADDILLQDSNSDLFTANYATTTTSMPLEAKRVSLPADPGGVDLLSVLPLEVAARYATENQDLFTPVEDRIKPKSVCLVQSDSDYIAIVRRMHSLGMVTFMTDPAVVNGVFATPKADNKQRLVVDARPANSVFVDAPPLELPTPDLLSKLEARPDQTVFVAKNDLDNFYHRLRIPVWMQKYFSLPPVRASDISQALADEFGADTKCFPCCTTLPMGWSHSAYVAQMAHEHIIETSTSLARADRISKTLDFKLNRLRWMVYIDDFILFGPSDKISPTALRQLQIEYVQALTAVGLPPKPSKEVQPSADGVECVGIDFDGTALTAGLHPIKLHLLAGRTETFLRRGFCSGVEMSRLIGHWGWACMCRREAFSIFSAVYRFIEVADKKTFDIWPSVQRELRMAMDLAPMLFSSLDSTWFETTIATDASGTGQGVVAAECPHDDIQFMAQMRVPDFSKELDRTMHPTLTKARWRDIVAAPWRNPEHINVLELRALDTGVRWLASRPSTLGTRVLVWSDSSVVVCAVRKGRSSSHDLLRRLRSLTATLLVHNLKLYCNWIPTEVNPADGPSRRYKFDSTLGFPGEGPTRRDFLIRKAHADATRKKYDDAFAKFTSWVIDNNEDASSVEDFDEILCEYFHDVFILGGGKGRSLCESTLSAISLFLPKFKTGLHFSRLALRGWKRMIPSVSHPPLTWDLTVLVAVQMAMRGRWSLGVATLLAFDCYLRVGELTNLRRGDIADVGDRRLGSANQGMSLRLVHTKTGDNQWVTVRSPIVATLMRQQLKRVGPGRKTKLFAVTTATYRNWFKSCCSWLDLDSGYVPHSLRHGGATHDHLQGKPLEEVLQRGRWASTKSARHYVQAGRALLLSTSVPVDVRDRALFLASRVLEAFCATQGH
jgi:hypothetical protein